MKQVSGRDFKVIEVARRLGDPPALIADAGRLRKLFGWQPRYQDIKVICDTAFKWEQKQPASS